MHTFINCYLNNNSFNIESTVWVNPCIREHIISRYIDGRYYKTLHAQFVSSQLIPSNMLKSCCFVFVCCSHLRFRQYSWYLHVLKRGTQRNKHAKHESHLRASSSRAHVTPRARAPRSLPWLSIKHRPHLETTSRLSPAVWSSDILNGNSATVQVT